MKKLSKIVATTLILGATTTAFAQGNFNLRLGADLNSSIDSLGDYSNGDGEDFGYEIGAEYMYPVGNFEFGIGLAYQAHSKISGRQNETSTVATNGNSHLIETDRTIGYDDFKAYDSVPLYLTSKYNFDKISFLAPYLKANLGYSFNFSNDDLNWSDITTVENETLDIDVSSTVNDQRRYATDVDNGLYYALGFGASFESYSLEVLYQVNTAKLTIGNEEFDANYDRISLLFNYRF